MTREAGEQEALFSMIFRYQDRFPELKLVFHVPNGGKALTARQGAWWKAQGVRAGVPDIFCAVAWEREETPDECSLCGESLNDHLSLNPKCSMFLPAGEQRYHGLFIEMKAGKGKLSIEQASMIDMLQNQGFRVEVCRSWAEAWNLLVEYIGLPAELKQK